MTLGEKLARLRTLEGFARGLQRDMTQTEVSKAIRDELGGKISQSYLSQIESGARRHLTSDTRLLLARFFHVHPGHLVDDLGDVPAPRHLRPRREMDDQLDAWLVQASEVFSQDRQLSEAFLKIAKHDHSKECLVLLGSIVENRALIDHLLDNLAPRSVKGRSGSA
jgi:transcriptional regulator with XRE-family HTH domain